MYPTTPALLHNRFISNATGSDTGYSVLKIQYTPYCPAVNPTAESWARVRHAYDEGK